MSSLTFADKVQTFYTHIPVPSNLPSHIHVMNPYVLPHVQSYTKAFLTKFYSDNRSRTFILGINPGRFGAGVTGVMFTDPIALNDFCGIPNSLEQKRELSSVFIYDFIKHWGGARQFYSRFFLSAICPLGFTREGINYNYYDDPKLYKVLKPYIVKTLNMQLSFGANRDAVIILGTGRNQKVFSELNDEYGFFKKVYALEHPRFIMQYKRKHIASYLTKYQDICQQTQKTKGTS